MRILIKNIALIVVLPTWLEKIFVFISNYIALTRWIKENKIKGSIKRDYNKRYRLYQKVSEITPINIDYFEFGVNKGMALKWWIENKRGELCNFYGFDTFKGLPEDFGKHKKGTMNSNIVELGISDSRVKLIKGMFQDTVYGFFKNYKVGRRKVIHLDADLFSSTICVLFYITPYLEDGDVIIFDEFNVPNHEWKAFNIWTKTFNIKYKIIGIENNYLQVGFILTQSSKI